MKHALDICPIQVPKDSALIWLPKEAERVATRKQNGWQITLCCCVGTFWVFAESLDGGHRRTDIYFSRDKARKIYHGLE